MKSSFLLYFFISTFLSFSQERKIDSLYTLVKKDKDDTNKINHSNNLSHEYINIGAYDSALYYANLNLRLAKKINFKKGMADCYNTIGIALHLQGQYAESLLNYLNCLKILEEINDKQKISNCYNNIGNLYDKQLNYTEALRYYFLAMKIKKDIHDTLSSNYANTISNVGNIYWEQKNYSEALKNYFIALEIARAIQDKHAFLMSEINIANVYYNQEKYSEALKNYFDVLDKAEDKMFISDSYNNIGNVFSKQKKYKEALIYFKKGLMFSKEIGWNDATKESYKGLSEVYEKLDDDKNAYQNYKMYILYRDSLINEENTKKVIQAQMNYEFDKKEAVTRAEHDKEIEKQKIIIWSVIGGLFLVALFSGFIFRSLQTTRKQKKIIEVQKQLVEEHQKEIIDSITYAKRLQEAILPPLDYVKKYLPDSFILYKPKDIVAGDFYWMEVADNTIFIAAADCTGHGVPGAMVSVVCSNALNRAVKEFGLRDTGKILDKVTELVLETFEKSDKDVKDGMDISLMAINKTTKQIQWSGANNPLWYIQNGKLIDITANKQPIGKHENRKPFTVNNIVYEPNIIFYLFTDGYADQFGGTKGKKFKYKQLEEKLFSFSNKPLAEQQELLDNTFDTWKGNIEQVDDVCIIGIKI